MKKLLFLFLFALNGSILSMESIEQNEEAQVEEMGDFMPRWRWDNEARLSGIAEWAQAEDPILELFALKQNTYNALKKALCGRGVHNPNNGSEEYILDALRECWWIIATQTGETEQDPKKAFEETIERNFARAGLPAYLPPYAPLASACLGFDHLYLMTQKEAHASFSSFEKEISTLKKNESSDEEKRAALDVLLQRVSALYSRLTHYPYEIETPWSNEYFRIGLLDAFAKAIANPTQPNIDDLLWRLHDHIIDGKKVFGVTSIIRQAYYLVREPLSLTLYKALYNMHRENFEKTLCEYQKALKDPAIHITPDFAQEVANAILEAKANMMDNIPTILERLQSTNIEYDSSLVQRVKNAFSVLWQSAWSGKEDESNESNDTSSLGTNA